MSLTYERFGQPLCSRRDPKREAQQWLSLQPRPKDGDRVVILGVGAGFHVEAWLQQHAETSLTLVDPESKLLDRFNCPGILLEEAGEKAQHFEPRDELLVLSFRPAWSGYEKAFEELFLDLTLRSEGALLKEIGSDQHKQKIWKVLQELIA